MRDRLNHISREKQKITLIGEGPIWKWDTQEDRDFHGDTKPYAREDPLLRGDWGPGCKGASGELH